MFPQTVMLNIIQHYTTLYNIIQQYTTLYKIGTPLYKHARHVRSRTTLVHFNQK